MAVSATLFGGFLTSLATKLINLDTDTFNVVLLNNSFTPTDTFQFESSISAFEITGTGYTAGGTTIVGGLSISYNATTKTLTLTGANVEWLTSTINAWYAVIVDVTPGSAAANPLVGYVNFGGEESDTAGTFQINWNASGIAALSHS